MFEIYGGPQVHTKFKFVTLNSNSLHQIQIDHTEFKFVTRNSNSSHGIPIRHTKFKLITRNSNSSHQIQFHHTEFKFIKPNSNHDTEFKIVISSTKVLQSLPFSPSYYISQYYSCYSLAGCPLPYVAGTTLFFLFSSLYCFYAHAERQKTRTLYGQRQKNASSVN